MNLKEFIKKKVKKDNTRFLVKEKVNNSIVGFSLYYNITKLTKYLKINEKNIESIVINKLNSN